jgi:lysophospholipase L1-like esterase
MKSNASFCALSGFVLACGFLALVPAARAAEFPILAPGAKILFIGDSITDGGRARTGNDYNHTMGQSYPFLLSAQLGYRFAERNLTFLNRGISGNQVLDLEKRWKTDVLDLKPDVLSILIGINDTFFSKGETFEQFEPTYDKLIADTLAALPGVRIILGEPFLLPVGKFKDNFPSQLAELKKRQDAAARLAAKYHLPLIRYQQAYDAACKRAPADHWCWDGIHPHYAGHALMAEEWLKTVGALPSAAGAVHRP